MSLRGNIQEDAINDCALLATAGRCLCGHYQHLGAMASATKKAHRLCWLFIEHCDAREKTGADHEKRRRAYRVALMSRRRRSALR